MTQSQINSLTTDICGLFYESGKKSEFVRKKVKTQFYLGNIVDINITNGLMMTVKK